MGSAEGRLTGPAGSIVIAVAYGAGLATGLSRFTDPLIVGVSALAALVTVHHRPTRLTALVLGLGLLIGSMVAHQARSSCALTLPTGRSTMVLATVDPGIVSGRATVQHPTCHGTITAHWPEGRAIPAGTTVRVSARWSPRPGALGRPDGTLRVDRIEEVSGHPGILASSRNAVAERIGTLFGDQAAVVDALLTGRRGGLDRELRDRFASAGMIHLLVISGFHVGLVAGWVVLLMSLFGLPRNWGLRVGAGTALVYAAWLGWPAPATRAAILLVVATIGRLVQRRWRPDGTIGIACLVVLIIDPWAMTRVGAWLSFIALAGVVWVTRWARQWWPTTRPVVEAALASVGATLATAPVSAALFGQVAPIGIFLNLLALPVAALLVPALGAAVLLMPFLPAMSEALAASARLLLDLLVALGTWGSTLPGSGVRGESGLGVAIPWVLVLVILHLVSRRRIAPRESARRIGWIVATLLLVSALRPDALLSTSDGELTIAFLAVGQGDGTVIRTPRGQWVVVDAGPADERYDAGARVLVPFLRRRGAKAVTLFVLSHGHQDHAGGVPALFRAFPVGLALDPAEPATEQGYRAFLGAVLESGVPWRAARAGERFVIDGVSFTVVHPRPGWSGAGHDLNEDSIVLEVRYGDFTALLTGDAGTEAEAEYLSRIGAVDVLKAGHHGSRTATGEALLHRVRPDATVLSVGVNRYGHPAPETMARLEAAGTSIWRTDRDGPVTLTTDGRTFRMRSRDRDARFDATDP